MGVPVDGLERLWVNELLGAAGSVLDAAARAVRHGDPVHLSATDLGVLKTPDNDVILVGPARRAADRLAALLDDVLEIAEGTGTDSGVPSDLAPDTRHRPTLLRLVPVVLASMRRELHHGSPIMRHAIRVAVVAVAGYFVGEAVPLGHGYWAPMTAVMVMRPEFSQTYARAAGRFGGTLVGVGLATAVVQTASPDARLSALLAVVCAWLMYLLMRTGYAVGQVCVAAYVVFLLGMAGDDWSQTVTERIVLTLVGGLLAMISYAVYPAWETPRLRNRLAEWLVADVEYAATVVDRYADPTARDAEDVRDALIATREARVAWQEALATAQHEPVRHRGISRAAATDAQHALAQLGRSAMVLEAHLLYQVGRPGARRRPTGRGVAPGHREGRQGGTGAAAARLAAGGGRGGPLGHAHPDGGRHDADRRPGRAPGRGAAPGRAGGVHPRPGRAGRLHPRQQHAGRGLSGPRTGVTARGPRAGPRRRGAKACRSAACPGRPW